MLPLLTFLTILVFLESSEVFQSFITQPIFTSLFFITLGMEPEVALLPAIIVQLFFLPSTQSGASLYPEYPTGYFLTMSSIFMISEKCNLEEIPTFFIVSIILSVSLLFATILYYKRRSSAYIVSRLSKKNIFKDFKSLLGLNLLFYIFISMPLSYGLIVLISNIFSHLQLKDIIWISTALTIAVSMGMIVNYYKNREYKKFIILGNFLGLISIWFV
ncbi:MAG: hypothetical protein CR982_05840 [Candidatus Cloacimonadota bacterium]|nr:MAG: hypothetical protein CR982_05840 [Candidatus Cloacimonadota bacterium]PIE81643.1 MAG: hypothetical protein CSA15_00535 [Candidatus Delongbacteria bacterium]